MGASRGVLSAIEHLAIAGLLLSFVAAFGEQLAIDSISLTITTSAEILDREVACTVTVDNVGEAWADAVAIEVGLAGQRRYAPEPRRVGPGERIEESFRFEVAPDSGRHPVVVRARYTGVAGNS